MRFPLYIAQRYLKSKSGNNIINIVTILACCGVIAGTIALFVVLSVFSGIKEYSLSILDTNTPDLRILPTKGKSFVVTKEIDSLLQHTPQKTQYTKVLQERAFFKNNDKEAIAYIKGVDSVFNNITPIDSLLFVGEWFANNSSNACVVDYSIANELDLNVYTDRLYIYVPKAGKGYISNPKNAFRSTNPQAIGVVANPNQEADPYVYCPLFLAQRLLGKTEKEVSYIDLKIEAPIQSENDKTIRFLKSNLPNHTIQKREEINSSFYKILNSEKLIAYLVSLLVVVMVLSNTSGTIIMVIVDKKQDIQTLINMGTTLKKIRRIFSIYGFSLNLIGMFIGLFVGIGFVYLQIHFQLVMITPTIPYPIAFEWTNVGVVCTTIVFFGALASLLASGRITTKFTK